MNIKISGLHLIDTDNYDKIIIREENDGYKVNVRKRKEGATGEIKNTKWSSCLKGLSSSCKIKEIINHCLDNSSIKELRMNALVPYYESVFTVVRGKKSLYLDLSSPTFIETINNVKMKYYNDRWETIENNKDVDYYSIGVDFKSSYNISYDNVLGKTMEIKLLGSKRYKDECVSLMDMEEVFLRDFIYEKLNNATEEVKIENMNLFDSEQEHYLNFGYYINCGNACIGIEEVDLLPEVIAVINRYNKGKEEGKKKRLKLEGF